MNREIPIGFQTLSHTSANITYGVIRLSPCTYYPSPALAGSAFPRLEKDSNRRRKGLQNLKWEKVEAFRPPRSRSSKNNEINLQQRQRMLARSIRVNEIFSLTAECRCYLRLFSYSLLNKMDG